MNPMSNEEIITMFSSFQNALEEEKEKKEVYTPVFLFSFLLFNHLFIALF